jgi:uncharacterized membrane protein
MPILILGLILFLGTHSIGMLARDWRAAQVARFGVGPWKGGYAAVSAIGLVLIIVGFGAARAHPVPLYTPPLALQHLNALFTLVAFVLIAASHARGSRIKAAVGHPMLAGVAVWAFGHLLAAGTLADVVLFGPFLVWSVVDFLASRARDRAAGVTRPAGTLGGDLRAIGVGVVAWAVFAFWLHRALIGVSPFA